MHCDAGDLFNDLAKEWEAAEKERKAKGGKPKSLWEELAVGPRDLLRQLYRDARVGLPLLLASLMATFIN